MKTKFFTLLFLSILLFSCSKSDESSTSYDGTYKLTAINLPTAQDLNGDGVKSINQVLESTCYNNVLLVLKSDNTYTRTDKGLELLFSGINSTKYCYDYGIETGTWSVTGSTITLKSEGVPDVALTINNNTLTYNEGGNFVIPVSGGYTYGIFSNIENVLTKQ